MSGEQERNPAHAAAPAPAVGPGSILRRTDDVRFRLVGGEAVVLRQRTAEILGLNDLGARLFSQLDARTPVAAILRRLEPELDVDPGRLQRDSLDFLSQLLAAGLVEEVGAEAGR